MSALSRPLPGVCLAVAILLVASSLGSLGCGESAGGPTPPEGPQPLVLEMTAPSPLLPGTDIHVTARDAGDAPVLRLEGAAGILELPAREIDGADSYFRLPSDGPAVLGLGPGVLEATVSAGGVGGIPWSWPVELAETVAPGVPTLPADWLSWGDDVVVRGSGFVFAAEGLQELELEGVYRTVEGAEFPVLTRYLLTPTEPGSRARATFELDPRFGTVEAGVFHGTAEVWTTFANRERLGSGSVDARLEIRPPAVLDVRPASFSVGRYVEVVGTGFFDMDEMATFVRFEGEFQGPGGNADLAFNVVPEPLERSSLGIVIESDIHAGRIVSAWFGDREGAFRGEVSVWQYATDNTAHQAAPLAVTLTLLPPTQVVEVRFLAGFDESLDRYGLRAARAVIEQRIMERLDELYAGIRIEFHADTPEQWAPFVVTTLEIGGPDPNGLGLLGYDSSPGKDVGNVRMADAVGGANAESQADGYPGYGGVFIESFLYWSSTPGLPGDRPAGAPPADPRFDALFGEVRSTPATLDEVGGFGDPDRVAAIDAAISALANLAAETAAHELGHALGLADPDGPETSFHNATDGPGCLMDAGPDRPFGERAGLDGFDATRFCDESAAYLRRILSP